jgi:hypothetical protein
VVLVCEWGAEERHDPVTHHLVHGALVAVHGVHHPFEHWIEDSARFLRITVGEQLHGALEVSEEDSDLFAFAFEGGAGREDALGEVVGRVGVGRRESVGGVHGRSRLESGGGGMAR